MARFSRKTFLVGAGAGAGTLVGASHLVSPGRGAGQSAAPAPVEEWVPTACWIGKQDCGMLARRIDGRVVKFEGHPAHPRNLGTLCPKGMAQIISVYDPNRVKAPLVRTNAKGQTGEWRQVSWDEALDRVARKIKEVSSDDPGLILWQKGRSKTKEFYDTAFVKALGATKLGHGAYCSDAGYRACEFTVGVEGVLHPDFRHTRYLLSWGWNITNAGGNKLCWITWNRQLLEARERGVKVVVIDPRLRGAGPFADEWLPIRPATDLALALALARELVRQGYVDREYLRRFTNAPFLVQEDGFFLRAGDKEQVWDTATNSAVPFDAAKKPALVGEYTVGGEKVKPAFQLFTEHLDTYTPDWAAEVTGLPAEKIRAVAEELGRNAMIGATIEVEGVSLPYRPVSAMAYHMCQQELGFEAIRAMVMVFMLLGAVGAVGGQSIDLGGWKVEAEKFDKWGEVEIGDPPYNFYLKDSKFFPINTGSPSIVAKVMEDPKRYGVEKLPEMVILHMHNPLGAVPDRKLISSMYAKIPFVVDINAWLSETADYYADVVLPAATVEKYEGPLGATDQYVDAVALRVPAMKPLFESRGEIDIYLDLTEKAGLLYGEEGYLEQINEALKLVEVDEETGEVTRGPYALPLDRKPKVRQIFDRWAKSQGIEGGVAYFEKHGVYVKGPIEAAKYFGFAMDPPFGGLVHRLYGEPLLRYQEEMKAKGAAEIYWQDYTPFPTWRVPTMDRSPSEYDLYLISYKLIEHKQSRSSFIPLLAEIARRQELSINPKTAKERGIDDGDEVWVESHNAVTGETRKVEVQARYTETIRPDTVGMAHHFGTWTHPEAEGQGPSPNEIFFSGEGYVANTADQSFHVKVRVFKA
ncbi:MAG TPA: molybdopterin-dependent oxidoreductase [Gaiellaceae bacterium]|nr:molybdopterin-dependent oxidoreductase [Gaiellaceae bacterium]